MPVVHRWSGRIAILLTVPVIIHCIYALGFGTYSARVLAHSVLGCLILRRVRGQDAQPGPA
jgi:hypothetical protein